MQLFHTRPVGSAVFDEPNLVSGAGLVPLMALARRAGLAQLAETWMSVPTDKGANAGAKVCSLVAGMAAGADSIDDMAVLRHGGMAWVLGAAHAPSTLGSFLRAMAFNLTRAAATITGPALAKATTATIRRKLIAVPGRLSSTARRVHLHLPARWPWSVEWTALFRHACGPPATATT
jgi:hypothetical protein